MAVQPTFEKAMTRLAPPWLRRLVGAAVMEGMGSQIESLILRTVEGAKKRFPSGESPQALGFLGRERRILRGPGEAADTYAERLRLWWDSHLLRGGPYALLTQLHQYFLASNNAQITLVYNKGTRYDVDTAGVITRGPDVPGWIGDGLYPTKWARFFLIFSLTSDTLAVPLLTEGGEEITTEDGEQILADVAISALSDEERNIVCAVPREWNAAHVDRIYIVLLPPNGFVFGFPPALFGDIGLVFGGDTEGVTFTC